MSQVLFTANITDCTACTATSDQFLKAMLAVRGLYNGYGGPHWGLEVLIGVWMSSLGSGGPHWGPEVLIGV